MLSARGIIPFVSAGEAVRSKRPNFLSDSLVVFLLSNSPYSLFSLTRRVHYRHYRSVSTMVQKICLLILSDGLGVSSTRKARARLWTYSIV